MAVWTISAQQGTSGRHIAELLAAAADVPLYDGKSLAALDADPMVATLAFEQLTRRFRRLNLAGLAFASSLGVPEATQADFQSTDSSGSCSPPPGSPTGRLRRETC